MIDDLLIGTAKVIQDEGRLNYVYACVTLDFERWNHLRLGGEPEAIRDVVGVDELFERPDKELRII